MIKRVLIFLAFLAGFSLLPTPISYSKLFEEICQIVEESFYDPVKIEKEFPAIHKAYQAKMDDINNDKDFSMLINEMLSQLNTSHTYYLTPDDFEYYHLSSIFAKVPVIDSLFGGKEITYPSIGLLLEEMEGQYFIAAALEGSPADAAGLLKGDEIIDINGEHPSQLIPILKKAGGQDIAVKILRRQQGMPMKINVKGRWINPKTEMLEAENASIKIIERDHKRIGYIHIYSYAGQEYQDALIDAITWGPLKEADALIIDLRYGLGGANPAYLNIFNPNVPGFKSIDREGKEYVFDSQWRKPAVYLVNDKTRSGKELLAYGAKKYGLATVIGKQTAGAVTAGRLYPLSNGSLLYLAVHAAEVDGTVLEGNGVAPDIEVPFDIRYCEGRDEQLEEAVQFLVKE